VKRLFIALVVSVACLGLVASGASAARTKTKVTINFTQGSPPTTNDTFFGKVKSKKAKCVKDRKVTVKRKSPSKLKIGSDLSDDNGDWEVQTPNAPPGEYFAKVKRTDKCKAATSKTITVT